MPQEIMSRQLSDICEDQVVEHSTLDDKSTVYTTYNRLLRSISRDEDEEEEEEEVMEGSKISDLRRSSILSYISTSFSLSDEVSTV